ncbi:MAG: DUF177 domain-containing protein [Prevotellaceae bacterium]|nr:DUF177 domain-containing protein [Prevotellaceae bacterium]
MCSLESFKIDLKEVQDGLTTINFDLNDDYFKAIDGPEVRSGAVKTTVTISKTADFYELKFHSEGTVNVPCDVCLDDMEQPISTDNRLLAKFGEEYSEDDDLITVEKDEGLIDVSWFIYEFIALSLPIKHVHEPGKCNPAMIKVLEEHSATRSSDGEQEATIDPRWSELEKLKTIIKD